MKKIFLVLLSFSVLIPAFAKIAFHKPDINEKDEIVFIVDHDSAGNYSYKSVFYSQLKPETSKSEKQILSCYPEQMELLSLMNSKVLQIRNRFGTARYYSATDSLSWINRANGIPLTSSVTTPTACSSDGKWICYIEKTGTATGNLILENAATEKKIELCDNILYSYDSVPVEWAPDGSILLYEKKGNIYFCSPDALNRGVEVEERYRKIGRGTINSVEWSSDKYLVYIDDYIVYRINSRELYTIGLYSGIIGQGTVIGRLPFQFNSIHDTFNVNADATAIILAQEKKNFTYFKAQISSSDYMDIIYSKPYTDSKASLADYSVFWDKSGEPVLWLEKLPFDQTKVQGSVIKVGENTKEILFIEDSGKPKISPDGTKAAFYAGSTLYIYDINNWNKIAQLSGEKINNVLWESNSVIYAGGTETIRKWNIITNNAEVISVSSAQAAWWDSTSQKIISETASGKKYIYNNTNGKWNSSESSKPSELKSQNGRYRVFCGTTQNPLFKNALYVRSLSKKATTKALFPSSTKKMEEKQKVALVFDAYDNADGLPKIISSLTKYNIPGTFFINGEFIRRYPSQTKQIALNGYECASMFFTTSNLTDKTFVVDSDFVSRGLGRNEDEFFQCTGNELSLYWHAPYYDANQLIIEAGNQAGYEYVNSIHLHSDNVSLGQIEAGKTYVMPEKLIEEYVEMVKATKGGMIPVTVGVSQGGRPGNLWEHIDLLINALLDANFDLVSVSKL